MKKKNLIHCITNGVSMNDCANVVLAAGAAPIMAHHPREVAEVTAQADALVLNLGATDDYEAMKISMRVAGEKGIPIVIDPVGVSGISFRREFFWKLLELAHPTCIRGNLSEIKALWENRQTARGVDAATEDTAVIDTAPATASGESDNDRLVRALAEKLNCIVIASGPVDIIASPTKVTHVDHGDPMMSLVTGTGCMSTVLLATMVSQVSSQVSSLVSPLVSPLVSDTNEEVLLKTAEESCLRMALAGECAAERTKTALGGTMTFRMLLIDEISRPLSGVRHHH